MQFVLLIYDDESYWETAPPEELGGRHAAYGVFTANLVERGQMVAGDALQPTRTAATVRVRDGKEVFTDGPFAETKEQLGGYYLVEAADLDEALDIAAQIPSATTGSIEIRPIVRLRVEN